MRIQACFAHLSTSSPLVLPVSALGSRDGVGLEYSRYIKGYLYYPWRQLEGGHLGTRALDRQGIPPNATSGGRCSQFYSSHRSKDQHISEGLIKTLKVEVVKLQHTRLCPL